MSDVDDLRRAALAAYRSIFAPEDRLLALNEAEDQYFGRMVGVGYAEIFRAQSPLVVADPAVFALGIHSQAGCRDAPVQLATPALQHGRTFTPRPPQTRRTMPRGLTRISSAKPK